jgi:plastocyanin
MRSVLRRAGFAAAVAVLSAAAPSGAQPPPRLYFAPLFPIPPYPPGGNITTYYSPAVPEISRQNLPGTCPVCATAARPDPCADRGPRSGVRRVVDVGVYDDAFAPAAVVVAAGTTVRWVNNGARHHTVTSDANLFGSAELGRGRTFSVTFTQPGVYYYHCALHPQEMRGSVTVR